MLGAHPSGHARLAQPRNDAFPLGEVAEIVSLHTGAIAGKGEAGGERKSGLDRLTRLIEPTELRQGSLEPEMRKWMISIGLDGAARPLSGLGVGTS